MPPVSDSHLLLRYICHTFLHVDPSNTTLIRFISIFNLTKTEACIACVEGYLENQSWKVSWVEARLLSGFRT